MTHMQSSTTTIITSGSDTLSPIERAIMNLSNELHAAREMHDISACGSLARQLDTLLARYDETDGEDHPNPAWARATQRALVLSAKGELRKAVSLELTAIKYADTPRRREISAGNIADRLVRLGDPEQAIAFFLDAHDQSPDSVPILLTGAVALVECGYTDQADTIFSTLLKNPELLSEDSELGAYLEFDRRARGAAQSTSSGRELLAAWDALLDSTGGLS